MEMRNFIDIHTHGIGNYDTKTDDPEDILKIAELHGKSGTAAILPTIYPGTIDEMRMNMEAVRKAMQVQSLEFGVRSKSTIRNPHSAIILGVHLEGPFLNPARCGALDKDSFIKPSISNLKKLIGGYEDIIKIIVIAPEIPGVIKVIEKCTEYGIKINIGHSDATYKQALDAKKAGASGITHLFNAMSPFHHREIGLAGFGLLDEDIYVEVIADNIHLDRKTLELIFKVKKPGRIILVSDSVKGVKNIKKPIYSKQGALLGSSITMADVVNNIKKIGISEAVVLETAVDSPQRYLTST